MSNELRDTVDVSGLEPTIVVMYTCNGCGTTKRPVSVRARRPGETILEFLEVVGQAVGEHHRRFSPQCHQGKCDLNLPMAAGTSCIGGPDVH